MFPRLIEGGDDELGPCFEAGEPATGAWRVSPCRTVRVVQLSMTPDDDAEPAEPVEPEAMRLFFVVERDVHLRRLLSEFLATLNCTVRYFDDGYDALDTIRRTPPHLVVTDVMVRSLDGIALCRLIKGDHALRTVKVVVLSAVSADERARKAGADAFLDKPIERDRIVELVRKLTGACDSKGAS